MLFRSVEPWLGDRFAVAAVDTGADAPAPVVVLQVSDADAADEGFAKLWECGDSDDGAWTIDGDWLLVGEDQETVDGIAAAAADASLADDDDFRRWTDEVGDSGIVALYAAPGVGALLAEELGGLGGSGEELMPSETLDLLKDFKGAAATLRFDDGGLELEVAADAGSGARVTEGESAGEVIASLPTGTAAAFAVSFGEGWFGELLDRVSESSGLSSAELIAEARSELGIDLPDDAETVLGDALAVAVDGDFDPESIFAGPDPSGSAGIGVKILGEAEGIEAVLEKIRAAAAGADAGLLDSDADADGSAVAVGPNAGYRERLLSEGGLGDSDSFKRVVAHRDQVGAVLYIDFDAGDWLANLAGEDPEVRENLAPLDALGMSSWLDGDTTHAVLKVTSD